MRPIIPFNNPQKNNGFTIIELVLVIVLLGVVSAATFSYIKFGANIFTQTVLRDQATSESRFAIERLTREVRSALPRSVRTNGHCLEFVPISASSQYISIPSLDGSTDAEFIAIDYEKPNSLLGMSGERFLFVYANSAEKIYESSSQRKEIDEENALPDKPELKEFTFTADTNIPFERGSPGKRYFITSTPVSWCVHESNLIRYQNYGFLNEQPTPYLNSFPLGSTTQLMAENVLNNLNLPKEQPFQIELPSLTRNNLILIYLRFGIKHTNSLDPLDIYHEVFLPNVP